MEVFQNDFRTCMDKSFADLDADIKMFSGLTLRQKESRIRITPGGVKMRIRAFIQWTCDRIRMGLDPLSDAFPVDQVASLIAKYNSHELWKARSKVMIVDSAKPPGAFT